MRPIDTYENADLRGGYQYVPLTEIIDDFHYEANKDDSLIKNTRRTAIIKEAKKALRHINKNIINNPKVVEITVPESLYFPLPHDFIAYLRVSVVVKDEITNSYRLKVLNRNTNINIATGYLQDHNAEILFDEEGSVLTADALNGYNKPFKTYQFTCGGDNKQISRNGEFVIDERRGEILFSSDLSDKEIVLEYRTDGLQFDIFGEDEIKVHKDMIDVLNDRIFYTLIRYRRNVDKGDKRDALNRFKTTRHEAKLNRLKLSLVEVSRSARNANF